MATISENLQTIKNSTDAIKQAIIDKGGTIEGDITTWANAISGISGGGSSSEEEIIFTGEIYSESWWANYINGSLNKIPTIADTYVVTAVVKDVDSSTFYIVYPTEFSKTTLNISLYIETGGALSSDVEIVFMCLSWNDAGIWKNTFIKTIIN